MDLVRAIPGNTSVPSNADEPMRSVFNYVSSVQLPWLLIFDNFDDPTAFKEQDLRQYWPQDRRNCSILITSRLRSTIELTGDLQACVDMNAMTEDEAIGLLLKSQRDADRDENSARQIVQRLGFHALAVDQARAYMTHTGMRLEAYLPHFHAKKRSLLAKAPRFSRYKRKLTSKSEEESDLNVFTTLNLSWDLISPDGCSERKRGDSSEETKRADKEHLIVLLAFFNGARISLELFNGYHIRDQAWMVSCTQHGEWDKDLFEAIFQEFSDLSLVHDLETTDSDVQVSIHPLVQDWAKLRFVTEADESTFVVESIKILGNYLSNLHSLPLSSRLHAMFHTTVAFENLKQYPDEVEWKKDEQSLSAIAAIGGLYLRQGKYITAEKICRFALDHMNESRDLDYFSGPVMFHLGHALLAQGKVDMAKTEFERLLAIQSQSVGINHEYTLQTRHMIAWVKSMQGSHVEAEAELEEISAIRVRDESTEHPAALTMKYAMIVVKYYRQGKSDQAIIEISRLLLTQLDTFGPYHSDSIRMMHALGSMEADQGNYSQAMKIYEAIYPACVLVLGRGHPYTTFTEMRRVLMILHIERSDLAREIQDRILLRIQSIGQDDLDITPTLTAWSLY